MRAKAQSNGRQSGFTLTELLVATALTTVIMSQVLGALIMSQKMVEATLADLELALQSRVLREKVLFNINEDDGGLMNICLSDLAVENPNKGKGKGLKIKPRNGKGNNRIALNAKNKLKADRGRSDDEDWLLGGNFYIQTNEVFEVVASNGTVLVNLDLAVPIRSRTYSQRYQIQSQILNP